MRWLVLLVMTIVVVSTVVASAATLDVSGGTIQTFVYTVTIPTSSPTSTPTATGTPIALAASVDIKPESLQKRSNGQPVTVFLEFPDGFDVADVDLATIRLCRGQGSCGATGVAPSDVPSAKPKIDDADGDGVQDLKVTFDRAEVIALVTDLIPPTTVTFTVSGFLGDTSFAGSDSVALVDPDPFATVTPSTTPTPSATASASASPAATATATPIVTPGTTPTPTSVPNISVTATATPLATATSAATTTATSTPVDAPFSPTATATQAPPQPSPSLRATSTPAPTAVSAPSATATP